MAAHVTASASRATLLCRSSRYLLVPSHSVQFAPRVRSCCAIRRCLGGAQRGARAGFGAVAGAAAERSLLPRFTPMGPHESRAGRRLRRHRRRRHPCHRGVGAERRQPRCAAGGGRHRCGSNAPGAAGAACGRRLAHGAGDQRHRRAESLLRRHLRPRHSVAESCRPTNGAAIGTWDRESRAAMRCQIQLRCADQDSPGHSKRRRRSTSRARSLCHPRHACSEPSFAGGGPAA